MRKEPFYHPSEPSFRVVYRPNNRWIAQVKGEAQASRTLDPWQDLHHGSATKAEAVEIMYQRKPLKGKAA